MSRPTNAERLLGKKSGTQKSGAITVNLKPLKVAPAPLWLTARGKKFFREIFRILKPWKIVTKIDIHLLAQLAHHKDRFIIIEEILSSGEGANSGYTYKDSNGIIRVNPIVREQKNCADKIDKFSKKFGLTPIDRLGLNINFTYTDDSRSGTINGKPATGKYDHI